MADPYRDRRAALKAAIVVRVSAGESVAGVCRSAGMPSARAVNDWARADAAFREALDAALRRAQRRERRGRWGFDPVRGRRFLERYADGETIAQILRDPAMPSHPVLAHWQRTDPAFAQAMRWVRDGAQGPRRRAATRRAKTAWAFDEAVADVVLVAVVRGAEIRMLARTHPGLPGRGVLARWRREQPQFAAELAAAVRHRKRRHGRAAQACAALQEQIVDGIVEGGSLYSLSLQPGMPDAGTLYRWVRRYPEFREAVAGACQDREDGYVDQVAALLGTITPENHRAVGRAISAVKRQVGRLAHRPRALGIR